MENYVQFIEDARASVDYWTEGTIDDFIRAISDVLQEAEMTRADLARAIGKTPGYVSKVLGGSENLTVRTMNTIAAGLELAVRVRLEPRDMQPTARVTAPQEHSTYFESTAVSDKPIGKFTPNWRLG